MCKEKNNSKNDEVVCLISDDDEPNVNSLETVKIKSDLKDKSCILITNAGASSTPKQVNVTPPIVISDNDDDHLPRKKVINNVQNVSHEEESSGYSTINNNNRKSETEKEEDLLEEIIPGTKKRRKLLNQSSSEEESIFRRRKRVAKRRIVRQMSSSSASISPKEITKKRKMSPQPSTSKAAYQNSDIAVAPQKTPENLGNTENANKLSVIKNLLSKLSAKQKSDGSEILGILESVLGKKELNNLKLILSNNEKNPTNKKKRKRITEAEKLVRDLKDMFSQNDVGVLEIEGLRQLKPVKYNFSGRQIDSSDSDDDSDNHETNVTIGTSISTTSISSKSAGSMISSKIGRKQLSRSSKNQSVTYNIDKLLEKTRNSEEETTDEDDIRLKCVQKEDSGDDYQNISNKSHKKRVQKIITDEDSDSTIVFEDVILVDQKLTTQSTSINNQSVKNKSVELQEDFDNDTDCSDTTEYVPMETSHNTNNVVAETSHNTNNINKNVEDESSSDEEQVFIPRTVADYMVQVAVERSQFPEDIKVFKVYKSNDTWKYRPKKFSTKNVIVKSENQIEIKLESSSTVIETTENNENVSIPSSETSNNRKLNKHKRNTVTNMQHQINVNEQTKTTSKSNEIISSNHQLNKTFQIVSDSNENISDKNTSNENLYTENEQLITTVSSHQISNDNDNLKTYNVLSESSQNTTDEQPMARKSTSSFHANAKLPQNASKPIIRSHSKNKIHKRRVTPLKKISDSKPNINLFSPSSKMIADSEQKVMNISFLRCRKGIQYKCYAGSCTFQSTNETNFAYHLQSRHPVDKWCGYCNLCNKSHLSNISPLINEFQHMKDVHINITQSSPMTSKRKLSFILQNDSIKSHKSSDEGASESTKKTSSRKSKKTHAKLSPELRKKLKRVLMDEKIELKAVQKNLTSLSLSESETNFIGTIKIPDSVASENQTLLPIVRSNSKTETIVTNIDLSDDEYDDKADDDLNDVKFYEDALENMKAETDVDKNALKNVKAADDALQIEKNIDILPLTAPTPFIRVKNLPGDILSKKNVIEPSTSSDSLPLNTLSMQSQLSQQSSSEKAKDLLNKKQVDLPKTIQLGKINQVKINLVNPILIFEQPKSKPAENSTNFKASITNRALDEPQNSSTLKRVSNYICYFLNPPNVQNQKIEDSSKSNVSTVASNFTIDCLVKSPLQPWISPGLLKLKSAVKTMLMRVCLKSLYKCMHANCSFYTDNKELFIEHLKNKQKHPSPQHLICSYCNFKCTDEIKLSDHIVQTHKTSHWSCGFCFYRSISQYNLIKHFEKYHPGEKERRILVRKRASFNEFFTRKQIFNKIKHLITPIKCPRKFFFILTKFFFKYFNFLLFFSLYRKVLQYCYIRKTS